MGSSNHSNVISWSRPSGRGIGTSTCALAADWGCKASREEARTGLARTCLDDRMTMTGEE